MFSCGYRGTDRVESVCYQTLPFVLNKECPVSLLLVAVQLWLCRPSSRGSRTSVAKWVASHPRPCDYEDVICTLPAYEYVLRLQIIKRMRKQWKPGPFLLAVSGLGTRLTIHVLALIIRTVKNNNHSALNFIALSAYYSDLVPTEMDGISIYMYICQNLRVHNEIHIAQKPCEALPV